jgi:hypothetical protein
MSSKVIWLEPEHFEGAKEISGQDLGETRQWKSYLNALALFGFEQWLRERVPDIKINRDNFRIFQSESIHVTDVGCNLSLGEFKLCLIPVDNLSDGLVILPKEVVKSPQIVAHFYVLIEVLEEEENLNIYGFLRYDQLVKHYQSMNFDAKSDSCYQIPLSWFDTEINNLLLYLRFLEKSAIPLPSVFEVNNTVIENITQTPRSMAKAIINLSQWWCGVFEEGWQSTENIWNTLSNNYAWGYVRSRNQSNSHPISRTKVFDFGLLLNGQSLALVVNLKRGENNEVDVLAQVIPCNEEYLPLGLKLKVTLNFDTSESESQEVTARKADNAIQLEFSEGPGKKIKIEVIFMDAVVTEEFLLGIA